MNGAKSKVYIRGVWITIGDPSWEGISQRLAREITDVHPGIAVKQIVNMDRDICREPELRCRIRYVCFPEGKNMEFPKYAEARITRDLIDDLPAGQVIFDRIPFPAELRDSVWIQQTPENTVYCDGKFMEAQS